MIRSLAFLPLLLLAPVAAQAQIDPSNPAGAPVSPSQGPITKPEQGEVIRDAAPGRDLDTRNEPRAPSVTTGVEEPQRTQRTRPVKGLPPASPAAQPAPVEQAPGTNPPGR